MCVKRKCVSCNVCLVLPKYKFVAVEEKIIDLIIEYKQQFKFEQYM